VDDDVRCRCDPSWRGRRRNPVTRKAEWQTPVTKHRSEVLSWLAGTGKGAAHLQQQVERGRTFESIGDEWLAGVEAGIIGRRKGRGRAYSATTIVDYRRAYFGFLRPEFGPMVAEEIGELEWQMWTDRLSREALSRSRIATHVAVGSAIYAWAMTPTRRYATRNPLRLIELPPNDERPRLRVAFAAEADRLLAALEPEDAVPYAIAFFAGTSPLRDTSACVARRPRRPEHREPPECQAREKRGGHGASTADGRAAKCDPPGGMAPGGP
jgi:hypothetical protein